MNTTKEIKREVTQKYLEKVHNNKGECIGCIERSYKRLANDNDRYVTTNWGGLPHPKEWLYSNN
jgi:hypothetical protein